MDALVKRTLELRWPFFCARCDAATQHCMVEQGSCGGVVAYQCAKCGRMLRVPEAQAPRAEPA